jgi:tRNA 2-thiouridine synthesizing protein A
VSQDKPTPPLPRADVVVDATGLLCPGPIIELAKAFRVAEVGQVIEIIGTDPGILADAPAWAHRTGQSLIGAYSQDGRHSFWIRKVHA